MSGGRGQPPAPPASIGANGHHDHASSVAGRRASRARPSSPRSQHFLRSATLAAELVASAGIVGPTSSSTSAPAHGPADRRARSGRAAGRRGRARPETGRTLCGTAGRTSRSSAGDATAVTLPREPFRVVANLPFARTTAILHALLDDRGDTARAARTSSSSGPSRTSTACPGRAASTGAVGRVLRGERRTAPAAERVHAAPSVDAGCARLPAAPQPLVPADARCGVPPVRRGRLPTRALDRSLSASRAPVGRGRAATARDLDAHAVGDALRALRRQVRDRAPDRDRGEWSRGGSNP